MVNLIPQSAGQPDAARETGWTEIARSLSALARKRASGGEKVKGLVALRKVIRRQVAKAAGRSAIRKGRAY